ncbi:PIN domain-containing protein [Cognatiyoonia sediminum]|uniref:PIN domain-containing protein n=1 Tax=Cognatiyoonia sediminum TaxID=1508389 RepID=A0A1M5LRI1_9RHOB|nr:PIN domain-containing protein [Cognatiyoonia sediminum]SHG67734.1 PIN domain-containing protein [Cognatiyoonia sediminum]
MRVLLDACVLYPTVMREVVLGCAKAGLFEVRWSERILEEWARATVKLGPEAEVFARGEIAVLGAQFPDAIVPVHEGLEQRLWLPDPNDVHVLASAVAGSCDAIMTVNAKDFPRNVLAEEGVSRVDPDNFLIGFFAVHEPVVQGVCDQVLVQARVMSGDDLTMRKLMKKARLPRLGKALG